VAYGEGVSFPDRDEPGAYRDLDMRFNFDGQTDLLINGVGVAELYPSLYAAEDEGLTGGQIAGVAFVVVVVGGVVLLASSGGGSSECVKFDDQGEVKKASC
jgi:hypothetical protein